MKFKFLYIFILPVFFLISCSEDKDADRIEREEWVLEDYLLTFYPSAQPTASGLYILPDKTGTGNSAAELTDYVLIYFTANYVESRKIFDTTSDSIAKAEGILGRRSINFEGPLKVQLGSLFPGMIEGIKSLKEGGSARLIIPSSLYKQDYTPVVIDVELLKVIPNPKQYESEQIAKYLQDNTQLTPADSTTTGITGLYFIPDTENPGTGNLPVDTSLVTVKYTLKFLPYSEGNVAIVPARTIASGQSITFTLNANTVIDGFEGAVRLMKKGSKATVIIPYHRAYGEERFPRETTQQMGIPPYTTLIYELEITNIE